MTTSESQNYDYDLIVIGGGSGGIACVKAAGELGVKCAVFDFVTPSTQGTTWGFGGTCVNVGCIPKKLMHTAAIMGHTIEDSVDYGWKVVENKEDFEGLENRAKKFDWSTLVQNVQMHIKSLNFGYKKIVEEQGAKVFRSYASFIDAHTIEATDAKGIKKRYTSKYFVIAVGGRPKIDDEVKGAKEHCITSDDVFSMKKSPGKTLVIGASYVALECAGFLTGIGYDTTVMIRSIPLRGFDRQCAEKIRDHMMIHGTNFLQPAVPISVEKQGDLKLVTYKNLETDETLQETYDTVLYAIGRYAVTGGLNLESVGIKANASGKIPVNEVEQTVVPNIYAIGDVIEGGLELTPVAIQAGRLLAKRLFDNKTHKMDYRNVPTTVFTPLEYGSVGYPEEEAIKKFGKENIKIYSKNYNILEYKLSHKEDERKAMVKLICNTADDERVVGFHYLGPNAGEVTQGVGIAIKLKATKEDFDNTVGIHPTAAETLTTLEFGKTEDTGC